MTLPEVQYKIPIGKFRCRTLYLVNNRTKEDFFVFSVIEKLEQDMQDYNDAPFRDRASGSGSGNEYKMCITGCDVDVTQAFIDNPIGNLVMSNGRDVISPKFFNESFVQEPAGKSYFTFSNGYSKGVGRVMPKRKDTFYVKTYLDQKREAQKVIESELYMQEQLTELSEKYFGLNLWEYKEHIGNCYLCWHNEIFKQFHIKGSNMPNGVLVDISYRSNQCEPFKLRFCDIHQRDCVVTDYLWDVPVGTRSVLIPSGSFPCLNSLSVYDKDGLLLYYAKPYHFCTQVMTRIGVAEKAVAITVKDEKGKEKTLEPVNKFTFVDSFIGSSVERVDDYFAKNEVFHHIKELEKSRDFLFFNGSKNCEDKSENTRKAREAVIDIINRAHTVCYICDPYFNENDFVGFATKSSSLDVKIHIINSKADVPKKRLKALGTAIVDYNTAIGKSDYVSCRVLKGNDSILHDRFIVSDDSVWYLGSSFSEFGSRACSLAKLSESAALAVKTYIEEWWNSDEYTVPIEKI